MAEQEQQSTASPRPQPVSGYRTYQLLHGTQEEIEYLPGTSVRIWYTHLDTAYPEHWHTALEIIVGERSHYKIEAEGVEYNIAPGEIMIMPGGVTHSLAPASDCNGYVYLLNLDFLDRIKSASRVMSLLSHPLYITEKNSPALYPAVSTLLRQMREDYFSTNDLRELMVDARILMLMEVLIHHFFTDDTSDGGRIDKRKEHGDRFAEVINYINNNYTEELTVDEIAKRFGLSKFYFSRLFKQYSHYAFNDYISFRRIKAAELLLADQTLSITDVAFQSGFSSLSTFSRAFRDQKNCTPSEYRQVYVKHYDNFKNKLHIEE